MVSHLPRRIKHPHGSRGRWKDGNGLERSFPELAHGQGTSVSLSSQSVTAWPLDPARGPARGREEAGPGGPASEETRTPQRSGQVRRVTRCSKSFVTANVGDGANAHVQRGSPADPRAEPLDTCLYTSHLRTLQGYLHTPRISQPLRPATMRTHPSCDANQHRRI